LLGGFRYIQNGIWTNSASRPFTTFENASINGFTGADDEGTQDDRAGCNIGAVTSGERIYFSFYYDTTGSSSQTDWEAEIRSSLDGAIWSKTGFFQEGAGKGSFQASLVAGANDSSAWITIRQIRAAFQPSSIVLSSFKAWRR
tara:strand:+ start:777 stop:1205 length:429 start_codon:yes stop_codon:yes gene_type:complete